MTFGDLARKPNIVLIVVCAALTAFTARSAVPLAAQQVSAGQMARKAQNPLADIVSIPFQNNTSYRSGPFERTQNVLNIQPVIPFAGGRVITRTILPIVWQPDLAAKRGTSTGVGDLQVTAILARSTGSVTWGLGPMVSMPTGGKYRGTQKWSAGPSLVVLAMPGPWVLGGLVNFAKSIAGEQNRADVRQLLIQPFVNYNIGETGWYVASSPILTADSEAPAGNRWLIPVGAAIGKVSRVGTRGLPVNVQAGAFYNVATPDGGPRWSTRVQLQVLVPKGALAGRSAPR